MRIHRAPILVAILDHAMTGVLVLLDSGVEKVTVLSGLDSFFGSPGMDGLALIVAALLSCYSLSHIGTVRGLLASIPQNLILVSGAFAIVGAVVAGKYPDGYPANWTFILGDQWLRFVLCVWHPIAVVVLYGNGRRHEA